MKIVDSPISYTWFVPALKLTIEDIGLRQQKH